MRLLLDTHVFIWWHSASDRMSQKALELCQDSENILLLSVASVWEMQIKLQLGKIRFDTSLAEVIAHQQAYSQIEILPINLKHVLALVDLPMHHKDPFDRLLIAQASVESIALISHDSIIEKYPIPVIW
jgi:PIN domain nuclease of toxin-antitoxin system